MRPALVWLSILATACGGGAGDHDGDAGSGGSNDAAVDALASVGFQVSTDSGPVLGVPAGDLIVFKGLPYAASTAGAHRFAPPVAPVPWTTPLDASAFGPACPQVDASLTNQSEDCLRLNVWAHAGAGARPVLVWIHGGGYIQGDSSEPVYDGAQLADRGDLTVVSINYRLGVLGFLALPQIAAPDGGTGNWGLRDQIASLEWVHRNIAAFGGDPARVMIAGESAGGISICTLLAAPAAQGLFAAAAMESGTCRTVLNADTPNGTWPSAGTVGTDAAIALGCTTGDVAACLRGVSTAALVAAADNLPASADIGIFIGSTLPIVDGFVLDQRPLDAIAGGRGAVPLIVGNNHDDTSVFILAMGITDTTNQFATYLADIGQQAHASAIEAIYPVATFGEQGAAIAYSTDVAFGCPALQLAAARQAPTYLYELERRIPNGPLVADGAVHGLDFAFLFGGFIDWGITPSAGDNDLSLAMQQLWGRLAHGDVPWAAEVAGSGFEELDVTLGTGTTWRGGRCTQLAALGLL